MATLWTCVFVLFNCYVFSVSDEVETTISPDTPRIPFTCVIGAGYSGLAVARYMKELGVNFRVFEASGNFGGQWRFDPKVGNDEYGVPIFTSTYKNLRTNTPRQTMEYSGFPFPDSTPTYPTNTCFYKYLKSFVKQFQLLDNIQMHSYVRSVKWAKNHWDFTYTKSDEGKNYTIPCDFVVIANGQYVATKMPKVPGQNVFKGKIMHSHDYKGPDAFVGKKVLLVGAGASGLDLATHLSNVTEKLVHSHHLNYNQPDFPKTYIKKPDMKTFLPNGVVFQDGTMEEVDVVICCTGYEYSHPFLDKSAGLTASGKFVLPLHQHIVNIRHPSMTFIGMARVIINRVLDAQAEYIARLIAGMFKLPSQEEMLKIWLQHVYTLQDMNKKIVDVNIVGDQMDQYFANLTQEAGVSRAPPVLTEIRDFNAKYRLVDLLNYRDYEYELTDPFHYRKWYNGGGTKGSQCPIDIERK
ncbi:senecionine N-oxygenase-like [Zerene cesonia]|uniref:senecionine N-oxygenase-like n=1 Tax=Zerene cesonia TaxID=33412 RepID=UPI0018E58851|nr:senecionine N-oxygenase-like [Zerene cesonia]